MTWRFIILSSPAMCSECERSLKAGRGAWWKSGVVRCYRCMKLKRGEAEEIPEEQQAVQEVVDQADQPARKKGRGG